jgi:serine/threonine protein phosphatase PrpC
MPPIFIGKVAKDHLPVENSEDSWAVQADDEGLFIALSDGAGTASFSRQWSSALTKWLVENPITDFTECAVLAWFENSAKNLYKAWRDHIPPFDELPYYGQNSLMEGSQATLLYVRVEQDLLKVFAVGDSCLYLVREGELITAFPISASEDFNYSPALIHTSTRILPNNQGALKFFQAECHPGDWIFMATDALACWIQTQVESGQSVWDELVKIRDDHSLTDLVRRLRQEKSIHNDDVTLISLRMTNQREKDQKMKDSNPAKFMKVPEEGLFENDENIKNK